MEEKRQSPLEFLGQDWSRFDFNRVHWDGLESPDLSAAMLQLVEKLFQSPEWRQRFGAGLVGLQVEVRQRFEQRVTDLQDQLANLPKNLEERKTAIDRQIAAVRNSLQVAAAPPLLRPHPEAYQLGAKVLSETTGLGLPGLTVQLIDPQNRVLAEGSTDPHGNVILSLPKKRMEEVAPAEAEGTLRILDSKGEVLHQVEQAVRPRLDHIETVVTSIKAPEMEALAEQFKTARETRLSDLNAKIGLLQDNYRRMEEKIQSQLDFANSILESLKKEGEVKS